jgi:hypothetical protein
MKKLLAVLPMVAAISACSTTGDHFDKRVGNERERQEKLADRAIDKAPKWMTEVPKSDSAIYHNGTAVSADMGMAMNKAKVMAFGKLCMSAGGQVNQNSKIYRLDGTAGSSNEHSEMAIKSFCPNVDISGVEIVETKLISEGAGFRSYVLVALPTGKANAIQTQRAEREQRKFVEQRSREAYRELDQNPPANQ